MRYRVTNIIMKISVFAIILCSFAGLWTLWGEKNVASTPTEEPVSLRMIADREHLSTEDYHLLWNETGLGKNAIDDLWQKENRKELLLREQNQFFNAPDYECRSLTGLVHVEIIKGKENYYGLYDLRPGDVLLTKNTHTFGYRHGHSALYIGDGALIEATKIGEPVSRTNAAYWGSYPSGIHLRIKEETASARNTTQEALGIAVAEYAAENLMNNRYRLTAGAFRSKTAQNETQCAHLIQAAFAPFGVNVSSQKFPVTPHALLESGAFEIIRYWGFTPENIDW